MDLIERIRAYVRLNPDLAKRILVVAGLVAVGAPLVWWQVRSAEEKAYILFTNGYYYYKNQRLDQAQNSLSQLVTLYPNSKYTPMSRVYLGMTYLSLRQIEEGVNQFQMFIDEDPRHFMRPRVFALWMAAELQAGRAESCVSLADRFLAEFGRQTPSTAEVLYRKGVALMQMGRKEESDRCFSEAAQMWTDGSIFGALAFYAQTSQNRL